MSNDRWVGTSHDSDDHFAFGRTDRCTRSLNYTRLRVAIVASVNAHYSAKVYISASESASLSRDCDARYVEYVRLVDVILVVFPLIDNWTIEKIVK